MFANSHISSSPLEWARWGSWIASGLALAMGATPLFAEKLVTVRSMTDAAYVRRRSENNPPKTETYVLAKGQYSAGVTFDPGLRKMSFMNMASTLAADLKKQNYEPAREVNSADLVIVVHWGVTMGNDKGASLLLSDPDSIRQSFEAIAEAQAGVEADLALGNYSSSALGTVEAAKANFRAEGLIASSLYSGNETLAASNAELLGFAAALEKESDALFPTATADTLRSMVDEERYFIVLMAYDGPALRAGRKHRLWTTRMSIRSAGVNFTMAVDRMSSVASRFNGTKQTEIALEKSKDRPGFVKVGDIKVIADAPEKVRSLAP